MRKITKEYINETIKFYESLGYLNNITLGEALHTWAEEFKEKVALVDKEKSISYIELWNETYKLALGFQKLGLKKKDNVIVQLGNNISFVKVCFALFLIGVRPILSLPSHREKELEKIADLAEPVAVIAPVEFLGFNYETMAINLKELNPSINHVIIDGETTKGTSLKEIEEKGNVNDVIKNPPEYTDIALFLLSGGTTGTPKLIPKIHTGYLYNAMASAKRCEVTEDSVYLAVLSIAHDYPLCCPGVIGTLASGGKVVLSETSSFDEVINFIEKERVTFVSMVPVIASLWLECVEWAEDCDISSLKYILIGAAKLEKELAKAIEENFTCKIIQGYGLGEGITCFTSPKDDFYIACDCQGTPISNGDEVKIVNEDGQEVAIGEDGELIQKGPYTFFGYYRAEDLNNQCFTEDGYFKTGDKAMITPEGNIKILGRVREQINRAGENVIPSEVESFIKQNEFIKEVAVLGVTDEELGERTCAVVVNNGKKLTLSALCKFLSGLGIAQYKLPDQLVYVESLPYKNVGKVDKNKLRTMLESMDD